MLSRSGPSPLMEYLEQSSPKTGAQTSSAAANFFAVIADLGVF